MDTQVTPLHASHFEALWQVIDEVAREKRYLAMTQAPAKEESFAFYRSLVQDGNPSYVALAGGSVVGWCDIQRAFGQARQHTGLLGIGLLAPARGKGLGRQLMHAAIDRAWDVGLTRIELTVRADNTTARALYERLGFEHEGVKRRAFRVDGQYFDSQAMALLRPAGAAGSGAG